MSERRTLAPLRATSPLLSAYWWLLCLVPPLNFLFALEPLLMGRAPEEAYSGIVMIPLLIGTLLVAPVVAVRAFASPALDGNQKIICVVLSLAAFPMFLLVQAIWSFLGTHERVPSGSVKVVLGAITLAWMLLVWVGRRGLRRQGGNP